MDNQGQSQDQDQDLIQDEDQIQKFKVDWTNFHIAPKPLSFKNVLGLLENGRSVNELVTTDQNKIFSLMKEIFNVVYSEEEMIEVRKLATYVSLALYDEITNLSFYFDEKTEIDWGEYPVAPKSMSFGDMEVLEENGYSVFNPTVGEDEESVIPGMVLVFNQVYSESEVEQIYQYPVIIAMRFFAAIRECSFGGVSSLKN